MLLPTTEINIDEVLDMLAYINARQGLDRSALRDGLEMLLEGHGTWNLDELLDQIDQRTEVIASTL